MTPEPLSDEDVIARQHRKFRESIWVGLIGGLTMAGLTTLCFYIDRHGLLLRYGLSNLQVDIVLTTAMFAMFGVFLAVVMIRYWPSKAERSARIVRKDIDGQLRQWRWSLPLLTVVMCLNALNLVHSIARGASSLSVAILAGSIAFLAIAMAGVVVFGPGCALKSYREGLADEWVKALRAQAARIGFLTMTTAVAAALVVLCLKPAWGVAALAAALCVGVATPIFAFTIMEIRADRKEEP